MIRPTPPKPDLETTKQVKSYLFWSGILPFIIPVVFLLFVLFVVFHP